MLLGTQCPDFRKQTVEFGIFTCQASSVRLLEWLTARDMRKFSDLGALASLRGCQGVLLSREFHRHTTADISENACCSGPSRRLSRACVLLRLRWRRRLALAARDSVCATAPRPKEAGRISSNGDALHVGLSFNARGHRLGSVAEQVTDAGLGLRVRKFGARLRSGRGRSLPDREKAAVPARGPPTRGPILRKSSIRHARDRY
jgi:hypothetical protein